MNILFGVHPGVTTKRLLSSPGSKQELLKAAHFHLLIGLNAVSNHLLHTHFGPCQQLDDIVHVNAASTSNIPRATPWLTQQAAGEERKRAAVFLVSAYASGLLTAVECLCELGAHEAVVYESHMAVMPGGPQAASTVLCNRPVKRHAQITNRHHRNYSMPDDPYLQYNRQTIEQTNVMHANSKQQCKA